MMNRKETISLAIVGMALLATVMTMSSPTQALALGHWNLDDDSTPNSGLAEDGMDSSGTTDNTNGEEEDSDEDSTSATADDDEEEGSEDGTNSNDQDSPSVAYEEFQGCLSNAEVEGSPTEQEVQDCMESSYSGIDSNENSPTESTDEDENGVNEDVSTDEGENSEE
ncbi:hypothetical protein BH18THE2_BH18THE2_30070 [soil metagenome]